MICFCISIRKIELVVVGVKKAFIAFKHLRNNIKCRGCFVILLRVLGMCGDAVNERKICKFWSSYFSTFGLVASLMILFFLCVQGDPSEYPVSKPIPKLSAGLQVCFPHHHVLRSTWDTNTFSSFVGCTVFPGHELMICVFLRHSTCFVFSLDLHEGLNYSCWGISQYLQRIFICVRIRHILLVHNCVGI